MGVSTYLAAPFFTQAQWQWNRRLGQALFINHSINVMLPQTLVMPMLSGATPCNAKELYTANIVNLVNCDVVIAVLDGPDVDSGTAFECGYALAVGKPIIGLRTDIRAGGDDPRASINLMLAHCVRTCIVTQPEHDVTAIAQAVFQSISKGAEDVRSPL